jgi:hypothetical protein
MIAVSTIFVIFVGLPLLNIVVGLTYKEDCPINRSIPLWLIVDGIFVILLGLSIFLFKYYDCSLMSSILALFLFSWLIRGSTWVYKIKDKVVTSNDSSDSLLYCNYYCYLLAFWTITISWGSISVFVIMILLSIFFSNDNRSNIISRNQPDDQNNQRTRQTHDSC